MSPFGSRVSSFLLWCEWLGLDHHPLLVTLHDLLLLFLLGCILSIDCQTSVSPFWHISFG
jgi:hypothetical protein